MPVAPLVFTVLLKRVAAVAMLVNEAATTVVSAVTFAQLAIVTFPNLELLPTAL